MRFLWFDDISKSNPNVISLCFTRVPFGVTSSPFLLNWTLQHHLNKYIDTLPETVQKISRSLYVDDVASGAGCDEEAYKLHVESTTILREGGFNLRKFMTNSNQLQEAIKKKDVIHTTKQFIADDGSYTQNALGAHQPVLPGETKVLGVNWNPSTDNLLFDLHDIASHALNLEPTKRAVVGIACRFYDPIGFVAPITVRFKVFFQELC